MTPPRLNPKPARQLTDRECSKILGATIGGLCRMATIGDVRNAVSWWAGSDEAWDSLEEMNRFHPVDYSTEDHR